MDKEQFEQLDKLALEVLQLSKNTLLVNLRFLDLALNRLEPVSYGKTTVSANGKVMLYNPVYVLKTYKNEREEITRGYLHMIMHCIFRHMYLNSLMDREYWDLACDIAVENAINGLDLKCVGSTRQSRQTGLLSFIRSKVKLLTAEKLYAHFKSNPDFYEKISAQRELFCGDDHFSWYVSADSLENGDGSSEDSENSEDSEESSFFKNRAGAAGLEQEWRDISERIGEDLETFSKNYGKNAGGLIQNLSAVNREKYDYTEFLKKFSVMGEVMKINDEEFDYVFYTYGLRLYEKMPLIEPLEYKEVKRIRDFVIAIDTSGSVSGSLVQSFVQKTYNILKSTESFFTKINLHIIQCDAAIQQDVKITSQQEFDDYLRTMKLRGFGGTDFRPVFSYVDELVKNKEFTNLKGLIYFTDGYGAFPSKKPDYNTAFVFVDDEYSLPDVPPWAIRLVLQSEEI